MWEVFRMGGWSKSKYRKMNVKWDGDYEEWGKGVEDDVFAYLLMYWSLLWFLWCAGKMRWGSSWPKVRVLSMNAWFGLLCFVLRVLCLAIPIRLGIRLLLWLVPYYSSCVLSCISFRVALYGHMSHHLSCQVCIVCVAFYLVIIKLYWL